MVHVGRTTAAWLLIFFLVTGTDVPLFASDYSGRVTFNGLPVPGATVTATKGDETVAATTDENGIYRLADLAAGVWRLTVEMLGFTTAGRDVTIPAPDDPAPFVLAARSIEELERDIGLQRAEASDAADVAPAAGGASGPVTARGAAPVGGASRARAGTAANPGSSPGEAAVPGSARPGGVLAALPDSAPAAAGEAADGLLINGSVNNGASTLFAQPRAFGNNRPNQRSLYTYAAGLRLGSSAWDARPAASPAPSYTAALGTGTFQGPIRLPRLRNRINLFVGYQGSTDTNATTQWARMPTDRERTGDFSQSLDLFGRAAQIVDPATGLPFENGVIPADRISPQAAALLRYYPRPDAEAAGRFNYQRPVTTATRQDGVQSRAAYAIDSRNQIIATASYQRTAADVTTLFGFEDARRSSGWDTQADWLLRPSPFMTIRTRYQYSRTASESLPYFAGRENVSGGAGIAGNDQDPLNWGPPSLAFASDLAGLSDARYSTGTAQTHTWSAEVSRFRGTHTVTFGGEVRAYLNDVVGQQDPRGRFSFTGAATGVDFADFLLGLPQTSSIAFGNADKHFRGRSYAAYFTDDWRRSASMTITLGVRWEYESPITELRDRLVNLDVAPGFSAVSPVLAGATGTLTGTDYSGALLRHDLGGIEPRLGLAWRPVPASSLVVRAGYGIYRNTNVYQSIATLLSQQPPLSTTFDVATNPAAPLTLADGFVPNGATALNTFAVDPDFRVGFAQNWQVSAQRDLPYALTVVATYFGTKGSRLMQQFLPNTYPAGADDPCPACPSGYRYLTSGGRSVRNAAQVQVRRRLQNGFTSSVQYTLAKAMDNATAFAGASADSASLAQNWLDLDAEYARSNFDQRHLVAVTAEYTTGAGVVGGTLLDGWKGRLLKDWTIGTSLSAGSGLPLTPVYFAPVGGTGIVGAIRPDVVGPTGDVPDGSYANRAAYAAPLPGQWGNAPRNSITGPRTFSFNAAISRTFRIGDRLSLDWRIDATNLLNTVTYASVNTLITSPQFGLPTGTNDMRKLRSSLRVRF